MNDAGAPLDDLATEGGVVCPHCGHDESDVVESRPSLGSVRRRRQCTACKERFTTYEAIVVDGPETWADIVKMRRVLDELPSQQRRLLMRLIRQLGRDARSRELGK